MCILGRVKYSRGWFLVKRIWLIHQLGKPQAQYYIHQLIMIIPNLSFSLFSLKCCIYLLGTQFQLAKILTIIPMSGQMRS